MDANELLRVIDNAFARAWHRAKAQPPEPDSRRRNALRARFWIEELATEFRTRYPFDKEFQVFFRGDSTHKVEFGLNELLYDIVVCRVGKTKAPVHKQNLTFVTEALWAIESEFARNTRSAIVDFSKLVLSSALNKLFVGPFVGPEDGYRSALAAPAQACGGVVYMCHVSHPDKWDNETPRVPSLYLWHEQSWKPIRE